uniref:Uncharacterized protein MANES_01G198300 n=1 Tax=Rhizophora mucronata TaxID=61149 RepID=A0A2P2QTG8_RHIMU
MQDIIRCPQEQQIWRQPFPSRNQLLELLHLNLGRCRPGRRRSMPPFACSPPFHLMIISAALIIEPHNVYCALSLLPKQAVKVGSKACV